MYTSDEWLALVERVGQKQEFAVLLLKKQQWREN
jgi:hypothetical protein